MPLLFAATACFTLVYTAINDPGSAKMGIGAVLAGLAVYYAGRWMRAKMR